MTPVTEVDIKAENTIKDIMGTDTDPSDNSINIIYKGIKKFIRI